MDRADLVALLRDGIDERGGDWADLGSGEGAFTYALSDLVGADAHITAVDKDGRALQGLAGDFEIRVADFTRGVDLRGLDGVVMANSLHFVRDKEPVLHSVRAMLKPGGRLIMVEYDAERGNPWVPHPFTYATWEKLAARAGFVGTRFLHSVPSRWLNGIWSAVSIAPPSSPSRAI